MKNDILLQKAIVEALQDVGVTASMVGAEVHHGVVRLAGAVPSDAVREHARRAAAGVEGVSQVIMDLDVRKTAQPDAAARPSGQAKVRAA